MGSSLRLLAGLVLLAVGPGSCFAYTILAVPMFARNSPSLDVAAVAGELQLRGHHIMTITLPAHVEFLADAIARHQPPPAESNVAAAGTTGPLDFITFESSSPSFEDVVGGHLQAAAKTGLPNPFKLGPDFITTQAGPCHDLVSNATLMQLLRDTAPDLVLTYEMPLGVALCGCVLSHALGVPLVVADGIPLLTAPVTTPQFGSGLTPQDLHTIPGFLKNLGMFVVGRTLMSAVARLAGKGGGWAASRAAAGLGHPSQNGGCAPALHLHLQSFLLEWPRALPPGHVMLGPTSPRLPHSPAHQQQIQPQVWEALQSAPAAGVVLVGIGGSSRLFGHALAWDDWQALAGALSDLAPARVIWAMKFTDKVDKDRLPLGPNVLVVPWVDYNDVLGHPATRLFISHCGVHSMYEAAFHGVPVLALPFTPDQAECSVRFDQKGLGLKVPEAVAFRSSKKQLVFQRQQLADMARRILHNTSYRDAMGVLSQQLQQQYKLRTPGQRAADEVEVLLAGRAARQSSSKQAHQGPPAGETGKQQPSQQEL